MARSQRSRKPWNRSNDRPVPGSAPSNGYSPLAQVDRVSESRSQLDLPPALREKEQSVSVAWIYLLSAANFGITSAWALEMAIVTPFFEKDLAAGRILGHTIWIVGPLSGLIVAPIVGALSDRCTSRYGRRRPFIFGGLVVAIFGMFVFSSARQIADIISPFGSPRNMLIAQVVAVISFCVLDLAINVSMLPVRALQGDLIPDFQQHTLQAASAVMGSLGDLCANGLVHCFEEPVSHIRLCFAVIAAFYVSAILVILIAGKEKPLDLGDYDMSVTREKWQGPVEYFRSIPDWFWPIGLIYALGFFMLFCTMPNMSSWFGTTVLGGDPAAPNGSTKARLYEKGVNLYGRAGLSRAFLQIAFALVYPRLLHFVTPGQLVGAAFASFAVLLSLWNKTQNILLAEILVITMAIPATVEFTLPATLTVQNSDNKTLGKNLGVLNICAVLPQLVDVTYTGFVSKTFGEYAVMRIAAVWGFLTAACSFLFLRQR